MGQGTKSKDDVSAPIGFLIAFLAIAMAFGAGGGIGGGGGKGTGSGDPCEGEPANHVVADWPTRTGDAELKCGDEHEGWEHLRNNGRLKGDRGNILNCISRTLARASEPQPSGGRVNPQWLYQWQWGERSGEVATVRVSRRTGSIITAYPGRGPMAETWARCAGR